MSRKRKIILVIVTVLLITVGTLAVLAWRFNLSPLDFLKISEQSKEKLTSKLSKKEPVSDQERLISMFGYPDEFVIIFDEEDNNSRIETWIYEGMEASFMFKDGKYFNGDRVITSDLTPDNYDVRPQDFVYAMNPHELNSLIGEIGKETIENNTGLKVLNFGDGAIISMFNSDGALVGVSRTRKIVPH